MSVVVLKAEAPAYGGIAIGKWNEKVVMIRGALPGETVEAVIEEEKKDYCTASVRAVLSASSDRVGPECVPFGQCGGCTLQYVSHKGQIALKGQILRDCLKRIAKMEPAISEPIAHDSPWGYRFRGQFKTAGGKIGFYRERSREVADIERCPLMTDEVNAFYRKVRELLKDPKPFQAVGEIHISYGNSALALIKTISGGNGKTEHNLLAGMLLEAGFSGVFVEDKGKRVSRYGKHYTTFDLNGMSYTASPMSFFQSHWRLNRTVVQFIKDSLQPLGGKRVLDLYSGAGNFSLPLAPDAADVIAVEENPYAIEDGTRNAKINAVANCRFIRSVAERADIKEDIQVLILDPPRLGLSNRVVEKTLSLSPERIVYISCNPSTLSRDLKKLAAKYDIESVRTIDFFPQTYHIESLVFLRLR